MITVLESLSYLISLMSIGLAWLGLLLAVFTVLPTQVKLSRIRDQYGPERRRLPILTGSFVFLGTMVAAAITFNTLHGINGNGIYTNVMRSSTNLLVFIGCYTWSLLYSRKW